MLPPAEVLVVCSANRTRSPLVAELLARRLAERGQPTVVTSAGISAVSGVLATPQVTKAALRLGLDLSDHRSRRVTPKLVAEAEMVITVETDHRDAVARMAPRASERVFSLHELAARLAMHEVVGPMGVPELVRLLHGRRLRSGLRIEGALDDPTGHDTAAHDELAREVVALVAPVVTALAGPPTAR